MHGERGDSKERQITEVLARLKDGDYSARVGTESGPLGEAVNQLARRLEAQKFASGKGLFALEATDIGIWEYRLAEDRLFWSQTMYRLFGCKPEEFPDPREAWNRALAPEMMAEVMKRVEAAFAGNEEFGMTYEIQTPNGGKRQIYARGRVERNSAGQTTALYGVCDDRTAEFERGRERDLLKDKVEQALALAQESSRRLRVLFENSPFGIVAFRGDGTFLMANPAYCKIHGFNEQELMALNLEDIVPDAERPFILPHIRELLKSNPPEPSRIERPMKHKLGHLVWIRSTSRVMADEAGVPYLLAMVEDITDVRHNEGERSQLRSEKEVIFNSARFSILTTNLLGMITGFSREAERITGRKAEDVLGTSDPGFLHDPAEIVAVAKELSEEYGVVVEPGFETFVFKARRGSHDERLWHITKPDGVVIPVLLNITGLYDEKGALYGFMAIGKDISEEVKARAEAENERLKGINTSKLASLGQMAGGIAHEINNPLAVIQLMSSQLSEVVQRETVDKAKLQKMATAIAHTTDRIAKIVQGLRVISRDGGSDPFVEVPIISVVNDTLSFCQERLKNRGVEVRVWDIPADLAFNGRAVQISQVLLNLLNNAHDALEGSDERWIAISARALGATVEIRVEDSGRPIPKEIRAKLFEPFFTTKGIGKGTGIGLGISLGIVKAHKGELFLDPEAPRTTFVVRLSRADMNPA